VHVLWLFIFSLLKSVAIHKLNGNPDDNADYCETFDVYVPLNES